MKKSRVVAVVCACLCFSVSASVNAIAVSGQGTWETTLQGRDLDGDSATFEAYYDTVLDITWLANANIAGMTMSWYDADAWAAGLNIYGITGWRLPTVSPINSSMFNTSFSNNATTDYGFAPTTTDGTDGGWRDNAGNPVSELGHLYYVTLGNRGFCTPNDASPDSCVIQTGAGLSNTGPFENIQPTAYWTDTRIGLQHWWIFFLGGEGFEGLPFENSWDTFHYTWAVYPGDVHPVAVTYLNSNFTMIDPDGRTFGGTNDIIAEWDGTLNNSEADTNFNMDMGSASDFPFFGFIFFYHDIRVFGPGSYSFDTTCSAAQVQAGTADCGGTSEEFLNLFIPDGMIGAHMLADWNVFENIDMALLWEKDGVFTSPNPAGQLYTYSAGPTPALDTVYNLVSVDGDGDGVPGLQMIDGPFLGFSANYNLRSPHTFLDVPQTYWAYSHIELLAAYDITAGCGDGNYCPEDSVTRAQMAVFLERSMRGGDFQPDPGAGNIFLDVSSDYWAGGWIELLYSDGITNGCGPSIYCPEDAVTREQMAVFLLRAKHGPDYSPPTPTGMFTDVDLNHWAAPWIEQLANEGITTGCGPNIYCPKDAVTRAQMAVFLVRTFEL